MMEEQDLIYFCTRFKNDLDNQPCNYAFFLGASCSVSSGIPTARDLVNNRWLPDLHNQHRGHHGGLSLEEWAKQVFDGYTRATAAQFYGDVMRRRFDKLQRQGEIERLTSGKDPGFGYAMLAQLVSHNIYGKYCNTILTTNFDDMLADALYLYTKTKPLVIAHESLAGFVRHNRTGPLVLKLHGDAHLAPRNTPDETENLDPALENALKTVLREKGLIFIGYGGYDKSIAKALQALPRDTLSYPIYWINAELPSEEMQAWLNDPSDNTRAYWIKRSDFQELMFLMHVEFGLAKPDESRFVKIQENVNTDYEKIQTRLKESKASQTTDKLRSAAEQSAQIFGDWWAVQAEVNEYEKSDPVKADQRYIQGLEQFPDSHQLMGNYANFLFTIVKDYTKAEQLYLRALEIAPEHGITLGNYAQLLNNRDRHAEAKDYYERAFKADPQNAINLFNYATFLEKHQDYSNAELYYQKALEVAPNQSDYLSSYANFLSNVHQNHVKAEEYYLRALEINPEDAVTRANFAWHLQSVRQQYEEAEKHHLQAIADDPNNAAILSNYGLYLQSITKDFEKAEECHQKAIELDPTSIHARVNYAGFLLGIGRPEGYEYLQDALKEAGQQAPGLLLECWFYNYAHITDAAGRDQSLRELHTLLTGGMRSPGWAMTLNVERGIADGHPNPDLLTTLSKVIADELKVEELEKYPEWQAAG